MENVPVKSTFVSILGWVFVVLSGMGSLMMLLEMALFFVLPFDALMAQQPAQPGMPFAPGVFVVLMRSFIAVLLGINLWTLLSSIGLLLRKNWARISFIAIMVLGVIWQLLGLVWAVLFTFAVSKLPETMPPGQPGAEFFQSFAYVMLGVSIVFEIGLSVLFIWIIRKLRSAPIRAEFISRPPAITSDSMA